MGQCCNKSSRGEKLQELEERDVSCKCGLRGENVKVESSSSMIYSVSGSGTMLGSCPLDCDTAYWEVIIGKNAEGVRVGVKRMPKAKNSSLQGSLNDKDDSSPSWCLSDVGNEGDVIGVYWDQTDLPMLNFYRNGEELMNHSVTRIRPANDIYAAVSVAQGSSCDVLFDESKFSHPPTGSKFRSIVGATNII